MNQRTAVHNSQGQPESVASWNPANRAAGEGPEGRGPQRPSAMAILFRRSWIVLVGAALVAAATYLVSERVPATYASSAEVAVQVSGTDINDTTLGANNLADQYAQIVNSTQVLSAADRLIGDSGGIPSSSVTGGAVAAQNLVSIRATASSPGLAAKRANAVTTAFIRYITLQVSQQASGYQKTSSVELKPLNAQIAQTQAALASAGSASSGSAISPRTLTLEQTLDTLIAQRAAALGSIAQTAVAGRPAVTLVSVAGAGSQVAPKPKVYALVGLLLALLILARLVVYFDARPVYARPTGA
jgi:capsular polysaccharide biosynthesis protein